MGEIKIVREVPLSEYNPYPNQPGTTVVFEMAINGMTLPKQRKRLYRYTEKKGEPLKNFQQSDTCRARLSLWKVPGMTGLNIVHAAEHLAAGKVFERLHDPEVESHQTRGWLFHSERCVRADTALYPFKDRNHVGQKRIGIMTVINVFYQEGEVVRKAITDSMSAAVKEANGVINR